MTFAKNASVAEKARFFASARASAVQCYMGTDLATAKLLWAPKLGGMFVHAGKHETKAEALGAARKFKKECQDWLKVSIK